MNAKEIANKIKEVSNALGWEIKTRGTVLYITKQIRTEEDFVRADGEYYEILSLMPTTSPGSIWGTDGSGVGALHAMSCGVFEMKKSGCSKRVMNKL